MFQISSPANAVTNYTLTIVASGGSNENTNWSYNAGTGEISLSASVSINASDIVTKLSSSPLVVNADTISVTSSVVNPTSNSLTLKSTGNINLSGGVVLESQGGNITLQSDSDSLTNGSIRLGAHTDTNVGRITSNGGNITLSGGSNPATDFAISSSDLSTGKPVSGVAIYGFQLSAAGGNIVIRGRSSSEAGTPQTLSTRAVLIEKNAATTNSGWAKIETTGLGSIDIYGDASLRTGGTAWGPTISSTTFSTVSGDINIKGKGAISASNGRGVAIGGPATFISTSGNFNIWDETTSANTSSAFYSGLYLDQTNSLETTGDISIKGDKIQPLGSFTFVSPSVVIEPYSTSFTAAVTIINVTASNSQRFQIGKAGSTGNITIGTSALTVGGPIAIYGNNITLSKAITATSSTLSLYATGAVTQAEAITATNLSLNGSGTFTLQNTSNNVTNLTGGTSASRLGTTKYTDATGGLTIGLVNGQSGIYSTGAIEIATLSGNLNVTHPINSTLTSGDSLKLYADQNETAPNAGDGHIIVTGSGAFNVESGARALIYSGSRPSSTGLESAVGGDSNTRSTIDSTTTVGTISPTVNASGLYALYRTSVPSPVFTVTYDANGATGGSIPTSTTGSGSVTVASNTNNLVKSGYTFAGWNTDQFGTGTSYAVGESYTLSADVTFYAKWTAVDSNSSSSSSSSSTPTPTPTPTPAAKANPKSKIKQSEPPAENTLLTPNPALPSNIVAGTPINPSQLVKRVIGSLIAPLKPVVVDIFKSQSTNTTSAIDTFTNQSALELILDVEDKKVVDLPSLVLFDNKYQESKVVIVKNTIAQIVTPTGGVLNVEVKDGQNSVPVNTRGRVQMVINNDVRTEGTGLAPNSEFAVYLFSEPTLLGIGKTNANGEFFAKFIVEKALPIGDHTLQVNGLLPDGRTSSVSMPVTIIDTIATAQSQAMPKTIFVEENPVEKAINNLNFLIAILIALAAFMVIASSRLLFAALRKNSKNNDN
jgi:uncharacterized repeat protein (TIGR02543 family)